MPRRRDLTNDDAVELGDPEVLAAAAIVEFEKDRGREPEPHEVERIRRNAVEMARRHEAKKGTPPSATRTAPVAQPSRAGIMRNQLVLARLEAEIARDQAIAARAAAEESIQDAANFLIRAMAQVNGMNYEHDLVRARLQDDLDIARAWMAQDDLMRSNPDPQQDFQYLRASLALADDDTEEDDE